MNKERYKLVILGESSVGKTSLSIRFFSPEFHDHVHSTIGAVFQVKDITLEDGRSIRFEIWDTAGQERYRSVAPLYYRGASIAMVVYDITCISSFQNAKYWIDQLQKHHDISIVLVGNKTDIENKRQVSKTAAKEYADNMKVLYFETSAKTGENVDRVFREFIKVVQTKPKAIERELPVPICKERQVKKEGCSCGY